jgi:pimeloyl-ACP methyl ester carboxylesterase
MTFETVRSDDGTTIAFERSGDGPPVIVVGGALNDRGSAVELAGALARRFTAVRYDRRGRGDSGDTPPYAVEREVEDLAAVIAGIGDSASVIGHSSGAALCLEAARLGAPVTRLALYEPPFVVDATRAAVPADYVQHLDELVAAGDRGGAVAYFMQAGVGLPSEAVAGMRSMPMWPWLETMAHTIAYDGRVMGEHLAGRPFAPGEWTAVTQPTLVMDGGDSPEWARNAVRALAEALPNAEHLTIEGQTHDVAPSVIAPILDTFFSAGEAG